MQSNRVEEAPIIENTGDGNEGGVVVEPFEVDMDDPRRHPIAVSTKRNSFLTKLMRTQSIKFHELFHQNHVIGFGIVFLIIIFIAQIVSTYVLNGAITVGTDGSGNLVSRGSSSTLGTVAKSVEYKTWPIRSDLPEKVFGNLKSFDIADCVDDVCTTLATYQVTGQHLEKGYGRRNVTLILTVQDGSITVDGSSVYASTGVTDRLVKSGSISGKIGLSISKIDVSLIGHFNLQNYDELRGASQTYVEHVPSYPTNYHASLTFYKDCFAPNQGEWVKNWCQTSNKTVAHSDFPGRRFFRENQQWQQMSNNFYKRAFNFPDNTKRNKQVQYELQQISANHFLSFVEQNASGILSYSCHEDDGFAVALDLFDLLRDEIATYKGANYEVNGVSAEKYLVRLYDANRTDYDILEWYELNGVVLRIASNSEKMNANHGSFVIDFTSFSNGISDKLAFPWPLQTNLPTCSNVCATQSSLTCDDNIEPFISGPPVFSGVRIGGNQTTVHASNYILPSDHLHPSDHRHPDFVSEFHVSHDIVYSVVRVDGIKTKKAVGSVDEFHASFASPEEVHLRKLEYNDWVVNKKHVYEENVRIYEAKYGKSVLYATMEERRSLLGCWQKSFDSDKTLKWKGFTFLPSFGLYIGCAGRGDIQVYVSGLSRSFILMAVPATITASGTAQLNPTSGNLYIDLYVGLPPTPCKTCHSYLDSNQCSGYRTNTVCSYGKYQPCDWKINLASVVTSAGWSNFNTPYGYFSNIGYLQLTATAGINLGIIGANLQFQLYHLANTVVYSSARVNLNFLFMNFGWDIYTQWGLATD